MNYNLCIELKKKNIIMNELICNSLSIGGALKGFIPKGGFELSGNVWIAELTNGGVLSIKSLGDKEVEISVSFSNSVSVLNFEAVGTDNCYCSTKVRVYEEDGYYIITSEKSIIGKFLYEMYYDKEAYEYFCTRNFSTRFPYFDDFIDIGINPDRDAYCSFDGYTDTLSIFNKSVVDRENFVKIVEKEINERNGSKRK